MIPESKEEKKQKRERNRKLTRATSIHDEAIYVDQSIYDESYLNVRVKTKDGHDLSTSLKLDQKVYDLREAPSMLMKPAWLTLDWWKYFGMILGFCFIVYLLSQLAQN